MKALSRFIGWYETVFIATAIFVSIAISILGVFFRYVMGSSLSFVEETAGFLLLLVISVGVGAAVHEGKHLRVDMLLHFFPSAKKVLNILADVVGLVIMTVLCYLAIGFFIDILKRGQCSTSLMWLPLAVPLFFMPLGYLTAVVRLIESVWAYFLKHGNTEAKEAAPR